MLPDPIHPMLVHFPIVLGVALPIFAAAALWTIAEGKAFRRAWVLPAVLSGALTVSAFLALLTGQAQEERVESVVTEAPIHEHEEAGEQFLILSGVVFLLAGAGLLKGRAGIAFRYLATAGALALVAAGIKVGHSGGSLVYQHGAAQAYVQGVSSRGDQARSEDREREHEEREERS